MKVKVFSVFDSKVGAFQQPFFARTAGEALRMFENAVRDSNSGFHAHPGDYSLFEIGSFDDLSAKFDMPTAPVDLGLASSLVAADRSVGTGLLEQPR